MMEFDFDESVPIAEQWKRRRDGDEDYATNDDGTIVLSPTTSVGGTSTTPFDSAPQPLPLRFRADVKATDRRLQDELTPHSCMTVTTASMRRRRTELLLSASPSSSQMRFPSALESILLQHQISGVRFLLDWVVTRGSGCLLADYMGLGKTLQCIALVSLLSGTPPLQHTCHAWIDQFVATEKIKRRHKGDKTDDEVGHIRAAAVPALRRRPFRVLIAMPNGVLPSWVEEVRRFTASLVAAAERLDRELRDSGSATRRPSKRAPALVNHLEADCMRPEPPGAVLSSLRHGSVACHAFHLWELSETSHPKNTSAVYTLTSSSPQQHRQVLLETFHDQGGVLLIPYSQLTIQDVAAYLGREDAVDLVILDEGHRIRNVDAQLTRFMRCLWTPLRICATGYPLQNRLQDLYQLLSFVTAERITATDPHCSTCAEGKEVVVGGLGSLRSFMTHFAKPLEAALLMVVDTALAPPTGVRPSADWVQRRAALLYAITSPYVLRRGLSYLTKLTGSHRSVYHVSLRPSVAQVAAYNTLISALPKLHPLSLEMHVVGTELFGIALHKVRTCSEGLSGMTLVRRVMSEQRDASYFMNEEAPPKMTFLLEAAQVLRSYRKRLIAFSQFHSVLDEAEIWFQRLNTNMSSDDEGGPRRLIRVGRCDGLMSVENRTAVCARFQNPDLDDSSSIDVLVFSLRAGCEGLNLHGASMVISLDVSYNPAMEHEAFARAFRLGQQHSVDVVVLTTVGSVETRRFALQCGKAKLSDFIVDGHEASQLEDQEAARNPDSDISVGQKLPRSRCIARLDPHTSVEATTEAATQAMLLKTLTEDVALGSMLVHILPKAAKYVHSLSHMPDDDCELLRDDTAAETLWHHRGSGRDDVEAAAKLQRMACVSAQELRQAGAWGQAVVPLHPKGAPVTTRESHGAHAGGSESPPPVAAAAGDTDDGRDGHKLQHLKSFSDPFTEDEFSFECYSV